MHKEKWGLGTRLQEHNVTYQLVSFITCFTVVKLATHGGHSIEESGDHAQLILITKIIVNTQDSSQNLTDWQHVDPIIDVICALSSIYAGEKEFLFTQNENYTTCIIVIRVRQHANKYWMYVCYFHVMEVVF